MSTPSVSTITFHLLTFGLLVHTKEYFNLVNGIVSVQGKGRVFCTCGSPSLETLYLSRGEICVANFIPPAHGASLGSFLFSKFRFGWLG